MELKQLSEVLKALVGADQLTSQISYQANLANVILGVNFMHKVNNWVVISSRIDLSEENAFRVKL